MWVNKLIAFAEKVIYFVWMVIGNVNNPLASFCYITEYVSQNPTSDSDCVGKCVHNCLQTAFNAIAHCRIAFF